MVLKKALRVNKLYEYQEDGFFEDNITLSTQSEITLAVANNIHANVYLTYSGSNVKLNMSIEVANNATLNLFVNDHTTNKLALNLKINIQTNGACIYSFTSMNENSNEIDAKVYLLGEGARVNMNSASLVKAQQSTNMTCFHTTHHTYSDITNYAIVHENGDLSIEACGSIGKGCIKSESHQTSRVLTLSDKVKSKVVPLLLIDDDDVKASHACSIGQMNEEQLYYLQSRGLNRKQALGLMSMGYILPITNFLTSEKWKQNTVNEIEKRVGLYV